jgi:hypothetical protein
MNDKLAPTGEVMTLDCRNARDVYRTLGVPGSASRVHVRDSRRDWGAYT